MIISQHPIHTDTWSLSEEQYNEPAWWRVDLGGSYDVYKVLIVNRIDYRGIIMNQNREISLVHLSVRLNQRYAHLA